MFEDGLYSELFAAFDGPLIADVCKLTPELLQRYPVWVQMSSTNVREVALRRELDRYEYCEPSRLAYSGPLPYQIECDLIPYSRIPQIACHAEAAGGGRYLGHLEYYGADPLEADVSLFTPHGEERFNRQQHLCSGRIEASRYEERMTRWRTNVEASFGRPLRELFPMRVWIDKGVLPPGYATEWTLPGLLYRQDGQTKVELP